MVMDTIQIRLTPEQVTLLQNLVEQGIYPSKSEAVRDAVRKFVRAKEQNLPMEQIETYQAKVQEELVNAIKEESKQYQAVKGTVDFYPEEKAIKEKIFSSLRKTATSFNFKEIETPAFETLELLTAKSGEEIKTQIFVLEKRSTEQLGLRFDLTIPATRLFVQKQKELPKPVKWFYIDKMWRYEAPQKGRLREFFQFGCELFGSDKPEADAQIISLAIEAIKNLGAKESDFIVKMNNRKLLESLLLEIIPAAKLEAVIRLVDKSAKITEQELEVELKRTIYGNSPVSNSDDKIEKIQDIIALKGTPSVVLSKIKSNSEEVKKAIEEVKAIVANLPYECIRLDLSIARGLAYYTGTVFEIFDREEKLRAIAGGGRYDKLVELYNGEPTPATGFGMGNVTLGLFLESLNLLPKPELGPDYFIASFPDVRKEANELISALRKKYTVDSDIMQRGLGKQLQYANSIGAKKLIVVGENEVKEKKLKVKDMKTGTEEVKNWNDLLN